MKKTLFIFFTLFLTGTTLWYTGYLIEKNASIAPDLKNALKEFESKLHRSELEINNLFNNSSFLVNALKNEFSQDSITSYENLPYTILIYNDSDSLLYWNNNKTQPYKNDNQFDTVSVKVLYEITGSKYLLWKIPYLPVVNKGLLRYTAIALIPLYIRSPINNRYLDNHFPLLSHEFNDFIEVSDSKTDYPVKDKDGKTLIYLKTKKNYPYRYFIVCAFWLYILSTIVIISSFYFLSSKIARKNRFSWGFTSLILLLSIFILTLKLFQVPKSISILTEFQNKFIENSILSFFSLGSFLISVSIVSVLSLFFVQESKIKIFKNINKNTVSVYYFVFFCVLSIIIQIIQAVIFNIVNNKNIKFEYEDFSKIEIYSLLTLLSIITLIFNFFLITNRIFRILKTQYYDILNISKTALISVVLISLAGFLSGNFDWVITLNNFFLTVVFIALLIGFSAITRLTFVWLSIWLFYFALMATVNIERCSSERKIAERKEFLKALLIERDENFENSFLRVQREIAEDDFFNVYMNSPYIPYSQVQDRLSYLYLDNILFGKYQYKINIYNASGGSKRTDQITYDELQLKLNQSEKISDNNLYFYSNPYGRHVYWGIIQLRNNDNLLGTIALELIPVTDNEDYSVYVELLSNQKNKSFQLKDELAFAVYKNNQRVLSKNADFSSFLDTNIKLPLAGEFQETKLDKKNYLIYCDTRNYTSMLILPKANFLNPYTVFSYLFCVGIIFLIFLLLGVILLKKAFKIKLFHISFKISLRERIQQGIVLVSLLSFVAIAIITVLYFQDEYNNYHKSRLERKIDSVAKTAIWQIQNNEDSTIKIPDATELSGIHKIDVNIYGVDGQLLSSSEDAVFGRRLIGQQMNQIAYYKLKNLGIKNLTQKEIIHNFEYLSGYVSLTNKQNQIVAFLNLPYDFAGNRNLQSQEVADFLSTLLNVYVIFLLLAGIIAFIIANSVTRPLSIIGEKLRAISVGSKNEKIDWKSPDDDISEFVTRYNNMIDQLDASTRELARTERETGWRDIARQIAHEIKNPLTPMKLQIQMLERAAEKDSQKAMELMKKISRGLIEQIDSLAYIASEFSNFAKMPIANNEVIILNEMIESVSTFFNQEKNIDFKVILPEKIFKILSDKDQMLRVLNNLIKNAVQAIPEERKGIICIELYEHGTNAVIKISDNGIGIPENKKDSIFVPYFTTKSSGSGIGLAMSYNIIKQAKGQIYFNSVEGEGTDFFVEIPLFEFNTENN
jgi:two-component system nitrogen regulation sensor histidine kinase NtrY